MKARAPLVLLAMGLSVGCASPPDHYDVLISDQFTDEQIGSIVQASDEWNGGLGAHVLSVHIVSECEQPSDVCVQPTTLAVNDARSQTPATWGYTQNGGWVYLATDAIPRADFAQVAAHELGHAMGLVHTGQGTLMCAFAACASATVTPSDEDQWYGLRRVSFAGARLSDAHP